MTIVVSNLDLADPNSIIIKNKIVSASRHPPTLFICLGVRLTEMRDSKGSVDEFANSVKLNISKAIHVRYIKRLNGIWTGDYLTKTNIMKNHPKSIQNPSKIDQNGTRIDENASSGRFRRQIAPRSAPGRCARRRRVTEIRFFFETDTSRSHFGTWRGPKIRKQFNFWG